MLGADLLSRTPGLYLHVDEPGRDGTCSERAAHRLGFHPDAAVVAIQGERIVFVAKREAQAFRGSRTRVVDPGGATVLPGLVDSHTHVVGSARPRAGSTSWTWRRKRRPWRGSRHAARLKGEWIVGRGWDEGLGQPTRASSS